jgi:hypothetical protein
MPRQWTDEQRQHRAEMIRRHKPWQKSTGPKTLAGKNRSKINAHKHGARSAVAARLRAVLRRHSIFLEAVDAHWKMQNLIARYKISTNEVIDLGQNPLNRPFNAVINRARSYLDIYYTSPYEI